MELDPGSSRASRVEEGYTIPSPRPSRTCSPTRSSPRSTATPAELPAAPDPGRRRGPRRPRRGVLGRLRRFEPLGRDLAAHQHRLAKRRKNISRAISSFGDLVGGAGAQRHPARRLRRRRTRSSGRSRTRRSSLHETLQELPSALTETPRRPGEREDVVRGAGSGIEPADPGGAGVRSRPAGSAARLARSSLARSATRSALHPPDPPRSATLEQGREALWAHGEDGPAAPSAT